MDKNVYETYEFLPATDENNEPCQYFVVQNDGTLIINREPVQFVSDVEGIKTLENVEPNTIYDVNGEQYFVNINSSGTVPVTEQFVVQEEPSNNEFDSNYIVQAIPGTSVAQLEEETSAEDQKPHIKIEDNNIDTLVTPEKENLNNLAEITITEDQYKILGEKGWVLFNTNDKTYVLNSIGLHDITGNDNLIQELQNEMKISQDVKVGDNSQIELDVINVEDEQKKQDIVPKKDVDQSGVMKDDTCTANTNTITFVSNGSKAETESIPKEQSSTSILKTVRKPRESKILPKKYKPLRIRTNYSLKDIPNKIVLGKTVNGKNLVARVVDVKAAQRTRGSNCQNENDDTSNGQTLKVENKAAQEQVDEPYYKSSVIEELIKRNSNGSELNCSAEDINSAKVIIKQLLDVPVTRTPLLGRNLIITKIVKQISSNNIEIECEPILVTGRVQKLHPNSGEWHFVYEPDMLPQLLNRSTLDFKGGTQSKIDYILHIHMIEIKYQNAPTKTSITFSKRRPPVSPYTLNRSKRRKTVLACSVCAQLFTSLDLLAKHQQTRCLIDIEDDKPPLIIDTDNISSNEQSADSKSNMSDSSKQGQYKCRMCPSSYAYAGSLSKHIMTQHIKANLKLLNSENK